STRSTATFGSPSTSPALDTDGLAADDRETEAVAAIEFLRTFRLFMCDIPRTWISVASVPIRLPLTACGKSPALKRHGFRGCGKTHPVSRFVTGHDFQSCRKRSQINAGFSPC